MTPDEAADAVEGLARVLAPHYAEPLRVLIEHARRDDKGRGPEYRRGHADGRLAEQAGVE